MPPKKRAQPPDSKTTKRRASKLAKENNITAEEEAEIREAFDLFAVPHDDYPQEPHGVLPIKDVRRCLIALNLPPSSAAELREITSTLDPASTGIATFPHFVAVAALKLHARDSNSSTEEREAEVAAAFRLFTGGEGEVITLAHLRRVARELREEVDERVLRDMIVEANGGEGVGRGVGVGEFEGVMRRAGVFG
ncbi:MAG: hypothetical protein M1822_001868 [Bathelium mastoideum]|nr:MAG: hypothetical protein M1822_001868 [Bathelium mastoideum]